MGQQKSTLYKYIGGDDNNKILTEERGERKKGSI